MLDARLGKQMVIKDIDATSDKYEIWLSLDNSIISTV